jgi:CRP/FNR family transcriptional regulator, cyclic AMP receptor protein
VPGVDFDAQSVPTVTIVTIIIMISGVRAPLEIRAAATRNQHENNTRRSWLRVEKWRGKVGLRGTMRVPYGLEIIETCLRCKLRMRRLFCNLPRATLAALQTLGFSVAYPKDAVLFVQGQSPREIFILCLGHVKISTASQTGKKFFLGIAAPGTVLGLSAAILGKSHEVTVEAVEPCQLRVIQGDRFCLLRNDGAACLAAVRSLSNDVQKTHECPRLLGLSHSVAEKLAKVLVQWCCGIVIKPQTKFV